MAIKDQTLRPKLRFPGFRTKWVTQRLDAMAQPITERAGNRPITPYTVTTGVGLVSQQDRFGRTIAGGAFKNYYVLRKGDFAYNKSATKAYPQGYVARFLGEEGAVPNSIFTCFKVDGNLVNPAYLDYLFAGNLHGRWLKRFVEVSARAHGSLSVNDADLMSLPVPVPEGSSSLVEQRKIAECLTSLDEWIAVEGLKLVALQAHKKGLMQQLFPGEGETRPFRRLPKFRDEPDWEEASVGTRCTSFSGGTPETTRKEFYGGTIPFIRSAEIASESTELFLSDEGLKNSAAKLVEKGDVLVALYGANSGDVALARLNGAINQAILCLRPEGDRAFLYHYLTERKGSILATYIQGGQGNLSGEIVKALHLRFPSPEEQRGIAACLSSLDTLIVAQSRKRDALRAHKKGLIQQLIPSAEAF